MDDKTKFIFVLSIISICLLAGIAQAIPTNMTSHPGNTIYLTMNGTSGSTTFVDQSPTPHIITANGDTQVSSSQGYFYNSSIMDGSGDYITADYSLDLNFSSSDYYASQMYMFTSLPSDGNEVTLWSEGIDSSNFIRLNLYNDVGAYKFYLYVLNVSTVVNTFSTSTSSGITTNVWYKIDTVKNGTSTLILIDNTTRSYANVTYTVPDFKAPLFIGAGYNGASATNFVSAYNDEFILNVGNAYIPNGSVREYLTNPLESYTANDTTGIPPLPVQITDTVFGNEPFRYTYRLTNVTGNNTELDEVSTTESPTIVFGAGNWILNRTVYGRFGSSSAYSWINATQPGDLVADFTANTTSGYPNDYFQFTDLSGDVPLTWNWTFGDLGVSTDQNPVHQYVSVGLYDVSLNVTNATTFNITTKVNYINISALPAPSTPSFMANRSYTTNPILPVAFTISSTPPPRMTSYNMSFGDGDWSNVTSSAFSTVEHTYSTVGVFSPTLYVYNAAGVASVMNTNMIVVSDPIAYLIDNPTTVNYGIPSNITLQLNNISHVDVVSVNITYNKTDLEVKDVYAMTGWSQQSTIGSGFVKINLTSVDKSFSTNTSLANIRFNVTRSVGLNTTEPLSFTTTTGVVPNGSYTYGVYSFNKSYDGSISPVATSITQAFNIYRTDTGELLSTVQVTNDYTGVVNGTTYTTTGSFTISSIWGTINLTSSASAFYANTLYGVEINGGTTNIYMTPYVPDNTVKLNQLYPKEVRFVALNTVTGAVIPGIGVTAVSYNATYDGTNWEAKLYGVSSAATSIQDTIMAGTTDSGGAITFPMISSNQYAMSFINISAGINQSLLLFPLQTEYRVWVDTTAATNNTLNQVYGSNLTVSEPNSSYVTLGMNYIDTSGLTENVTFSVVSSENSTVIYTETFTTGITTGVISDYTIQNIRGDGFVWKYVAYRSDSSVLSQGAGVTMKGPNGVLVDLGLPSTGWYQWISMCCLFMLASLASQRTKQFWALLIPIFAAIFLWFGWFTGKSTLAGIIILCVVLGAIVYMKSSLREKFGIGGPGTMLLNIIVYLLILQACVGFINGLQIWSDAGMTNQAIAPSNTYTNIEISTISNLQGAAGLVGTIVATATIFVDMALTALSMFGAILFSLVTIYPTIQTLFPWMLSSPQTITLLALFQIGIYVLYILFIYQTWYKPTIGTADF